MGHGCVQVPGCVEGYPWICFMQWVFGDVTLVCRLIHDGNLGYHWYYSYYVLFRMSSLSVSARIPCIYSSCARKGLEPAGWYNEKNMLLHDVGIPHDDVIKWKHFLRYWPFVQGIHRPPVNSPHKDQWRGALMFSLICALTNVWVNNRYAGDWRRHRAHCDATVMVTWCRNAWWTVSRNYIAFFLCRDVENVLLIFILIA